ncbi:hypothetical protein IC582_009324 [Cucumis melo]
MLCFLLKFCEVDHFSLFVICVEHAYVFSSLFSYSCWSKLICTKLCKSLGIVFYIIHVLNSFKTIK